MNAKNNDSSGSAGFKPQGRGTLIGSLPVSDHREGLDLINRYTPEIPLWPQLPSNRQEGMLVQFMEGMIGLVEGERTYFDTTGSFEEDLLPFFEDFLAASEDHSFLMNSRFAVSEERAAGLYLLHNNADPAQAVALKGQITGPFTQLTGLQDQDRKLGYYTPSLREMVVQGLSLKAAWQVRFLQETGLPVIVFIDEPALAGLGSSSFISISHDDIGNDIGQVATAIQNAGGLAGVHVCANTDWTLLLRSELDVISFDAHGFFDRFITCIDDVHAYLNRGGIIAWGIVPTGSSDLVASETTESLVKMWEDQAAKMATDTWTIPAILNQTLITPSCGTGSLDLVSAEKVLRLTNEVSETLRRKYLN